MAKFYQSEKWRKQALRLLSVTAAATLSLGVFASCAEATTEEEDDSSVSATDTQLIKNGNFEFYGDKDTEELIDKRGVINTPDSWSFTSGSPTSDTASGILDAAEWTYYTRTGGYAFSTYTKDGEDVTTFSSIDEAYAHWEDDTVSAYDRLKFLSLYEEEIDDLDANSKEAELFADYNYSVDFEDVEYLAEEIGTGLTLHNDAQQREDGETSVLMIHNRKTSDNVLGTAQYYTSSTTITLDAGTAAKVSVFVRTDNLAHYYEGDNSALNRRGGAYIGVTNTVGGTTLEQMQIKNINTAGQWRQYDIYVRASTFATTTFKIVLGLGQGSSSDRYYAVNGYAFFDDVSCEIISAEDYLDATTNEDGSTKEGVKLCTVDSVAEEKQFDTDTVSETTFALDLYAGFDSDAAFLTDTSIALTAEKSGSKTYTSESIDASLGDAADNYTAVTNLTALGTNTNSYIQKIFSNDFDGKFPFDEDSQILMLMSQNGAAYTAKLPEMTLAAGERQLISFFVKTSSIASGLTGASATVVDGENKTSIAAFDSTVIEPVDIDSEDESKSDIYKGWVQCFFFLENDTEEDKTYHIELSYGPTTIVGTNKFSYGDGYAAFTNFESKSLSKTEYSYASTGDRAVKVSLTGKTENTSKFDSVSATDAKTIETTVALPSTFTGVLGGSNYVTEDGGKNVKPAGVDAGLINQDYAQAYYTSGEAWTDALSEGAHGASSADAWWTNLFSNAYQPLIIVNREQAAYGFFSQSLSVAASSYQKISLRIKVSVGATATVYLSDLSDTQVSGAFLTPDVPAITFWYDDNGNICKSDPTDSSFNKKTDVLFELQENGLYLRKGDTSGTYYANLYNYETDDENNLVTTDGTIAFFFNDQDNSYYAYFDEETNAYTVKVENLPKTVDGEVITRYDYSSTALPTSCITVRGTDTPDTWVTVSFYVATGNTAKNYRLEVWSGTRDGSVQNPAGSYVFFDNYSNESVSSDYSTLLDETVSAVKDKLGVSQDDKIEDPDYALYYTFTFYDSANYLRYDVNEDEDELGNPYGSYVQSQQEEALIYLYYFDQEGALTNTPSHFFFLDYTATDVTVEEDDLSSDTDEDTTDTSEAESETNIWLLISSGIMAVVLLLVILIIIIRRVLEKKRPKANFAKKTHRPNPGRRGNVSSAKKETPKDENDPYND